MSCRRLLCISVLAAFLAAAGIVVSVLYGGAGSWSVPVHLSGGFRIQVRATPLIRMMTSSLGRQLLDGITWKTRIGTLHFQERDSGLLVVCNECCLHAPRFSTTPVQIPHLYLHLRRTGGDLNGWLSDKDNVSALRITFDGTLADDTLTIRWALPRNDLASLLRIVESTVPEIRHAVVRGRLTAHGTIELPGGHWSVIPQLEGIEVYGLGTERLRYGTFKFTCRNKNGVTEQRITGEGAPGWIPLAHMGSFLPRAVLAAEDARFYNHAGYDMVELAPLLAKPDHGDQRGASTITQQLAKNFFTGADMTFSRKLRELLYAVEMERTLGKARILSLYLNTVDWGPGLCGVREASSVYFARSPSRLTLMEAAWMGGILRNPHRAYKTEYLDQQIDQNRLAWVAKRLSSRMSKQTAGRLRFARPQEHDSQLLMAG